MISIKSWRYHDLGFGEQRIPECLIEFGYQNGKKGGWKLHERHVHLPTRLQNEHTRTCFLFPLMLALFFFSFFFFRFFPTLKPGAKVQATERSRKSGRSRRNLGGNWATVLRASRRRIASLPVGRSICKLRISAWWKATWPHTNSRLSVWIMIIVEDLSLIFIEARAHQSTYCVRFFYSADSEWGSRIVI